MSESEKNTDAAQVRDDGLNSIIEQLGLSGRVVPVHLLPEEHDPDSNTKHFAERIPGSRYNYLSEIGRGGFGLVYKARDKDLGRDVAIKTLKDESSSREQVVERFIEEAQIGAQLQHPGIVPVYEMGVDGKKRPFFAMKLIKGRTLRALLEERKDSAQELGKFLGIFQVVCQTMAYVHTRGVIHRDLKPSNIMVGAFGEVLVVDWGMGKILPRTDSHKQQEVKTPSEAPSISIIATVRSDGHGTPSIMGSVMGTPNYMSPEQARGDVDLVDESSDVFALGGILCEILTGRPPYFGSTEDVVTAATRGQVYAAHERLDQCGADLQLIDFTKRCLSPLRAGRPRNAKIVANFISEHLIAVEQRAHTAQLEAAEARVKVAEEQRRRKLTLALSGVTLMLIILAGGGWWWIESARRFDESEANLVVGRIIDDTIRLHEEARSANVSLDKWNQVIASAKRASESTRSSKADKAVQARSTSLVELIEREGAEAITRIGILERDRALSEHLASIRLIRADDIDSNRDVEQYEAAFRSYGIDLETLSPEEASTKIRNSQIRETLISALEDWSRTKQFVANLEIDLSLPSRVADLADDNPLRKEIRTCRDLKRLCEIAKMSAVDQLPLSTLLLLSIRMSAAGDKVAAAEAASRTQRLHPNDFWANWEAAFWTERQRTKKSIDLNHRIRYLTAALAVRPQSWATWAELGVALRDFGDFNGSIAAYQEAVRLNPDNKATTGGLIVTLTAAGKNEDAILICKQQIEKHPEDPEWCNTIGERFVGIGNLEEAVKYFSKAVELKPDFAHAHHVLGINLADLKRFDESITAHRKAVQLKPKDAIVRLYLAQALSAKGDVAQAIVEFQNTLALDPRSSSAHLGLSELYQNKGDLAKAISAIEDDIRVSGLTVWNQQRLSLALKTQRKYREALAAIREAIHLEPSKSRLQYEYGEICQDAHDWEGAAAAYQRAIDLGWRDGAVYSALGVAHSRLGNRSTSISAFRDALAKLASSRAILLRLANELRRNDQLDEALELIRSSVPSQSGHPSLYFNMSYTLRDMGRLRDAADMMKRVESAAGLFLDWSIPVKEKVIEFEERAVIESKLHAAIRKEWAPSSLPEWMRLAEVAYYKKYYSFSADCYVQGFRSISTQAAKFASTAAYDAACSAILAAAGKGNDSSMLNDTDRARLRSQAMQWLREALSRVANELDANKYTEVIDRLEWWKIDPDLDSTREPQSKSLAIDEQAEFHLFWRDVDKILTKAVLLQQN